MPQQQEPTIRGLLIPLADATLLLPGAVVAEVIGYQDPAPMPGHDALSWLLGAADWRGLRLPVVSVEALLGGAVADAGVRARLIVLKAVSGQSQMPFFAVLAQQIPRLATVTPDTIEPLGEDEEPAADDYRHVLANGEPAVIPDLQAIESQVYGAIYR